MKKFIRWSLYYCISFFSFLGAVQYPMDQLKHIADGLNIEGGTIHHQYLRKEQIWANLCIVLDRPFADGVEWQKLTSLNSYPLKEASLSDYNETQVNFVYTTIMHYYIMRAHEITGKPSNHIAKILVQVHRNTSGPKHVELLEQLLCECFPYLNKIKEPKKTITYSKFELFSYFFPDNNVMVDFCYGAAPENLGQEGKYDEVDIILSFSLVAGFHPDWKSGSLLIPSVFIPFYLRDVSIDFEKTYFVRNHLNQIVSDLVVCQDETVLEKINRHFFSQNSEKKHMKARRFTEEDFKNALILQSEEIFNPSHLPETFTIDRAN